VAYHKVEAVVLRRVDYSETSLVLTLFTPEAGLLKGIAKGAKRSKSLFDAGLEPFVRCVLVYLDRRSRGLHILTEAAVVETSPGLRQSLDRLNAAWLAAELIPALSEEGDPEPRTYALLLELLHALENAHAYVGVTYVDGQEHVFLLAQLYVGDIPTSITHTGALVTALAPAC